MRATGRARVNPSSPRAFAICDRCGFMYNHVNLRWQHDYRGARLTNTRLLVCGDCLDAPQPQMKPRILTADPLTIKDPRSEMYSSGYLSLSPADSETSYVLTWGPDSLLWGVDGLVWGYNVLPATVQLVSCTGTFSVELPTAVTAAGSDTPPVTTGTDGRTITLQNNGTGTITITAPSGQTIDGAASYTLTAGNEIAFWSDGANWRTI